jgi:hypothetical protein
VELDRVVLLGLWGDVPNQYVDADEKQTPQPIITRTMTCNHPLSEIERRGEPDWKNGSETIWYYGFCMNCGEDVEVEYEFSRTKPR